jgi:hypothetical protein
VYYSTIKQNELKYENIHSGSLLEQIQIFRIFECNFERRVFKPRRNLGLPGPSLIILEHP